MTLEPLPRSKQWAYATGMTGWSILNNIVAVMITYFYLPPRGSGMIELLPSAAVILVFNVLFLVMMGSRLTDVIVDPIVAHLSDNSRNRLGRRIPFMRWSVLPAVICCILVFLPYNEKGVGGNTAWLAIMVTLYFMFSTAYAIPFNALLPELAHDDAAKLRLSTLQSFGYVSGMIISSNVPSLADLIQYLFDVPERLHAVQYSIWFFAALGGILMAVPAWSIDEKRYCRAQPSDESFFKALRTTLRDHNFRVFIAADFAYYMAVAVIVNSLMFYVKVLLRLPEKDGPLGMAVMVLVSLIYYFFIKQLEQRFGRKRLVIFSFFFMSLIFVMVYFFGQLPFSGRTQLIGLGLFFSLPLTLLGVLPNAIIAGIAADDAKKTGIQKEGMYFAVRYMFVKMGQTLGFSVSAMLTLFGKDIGNDYGIRLTGVVGAILCVLAGFVFFSFREARRKN